MHMPPAAAVLAIALYTVSQEPALDFAALLRANQDALQAYTHKRRTEVTIKGHTRSRVDEVRHIEGETRVTPVETAPATSGRRAGPLARKRIEKKAKGMREDAQRLTSLLQQYLRPASGLLTKARLERDGAAARIVAEGLVRPKDSFTLVFDAEARQPRSISIRTDLDGKPVTMDVAFARLPEDGPFYPATATIAHPKKDLKVRVENFDYAK